MSISSQPCTRGCAYCFIYHRDYRPFGNVFESGRFAHLQSLVEDSDRVILQPAADVEITDIPDFVGKIDTLSTLKRTISFATKGSITDTAIDRLSAINRSLEALGRCIQICVSIPTIEEWTKFERKTAHPLERISLLKRLHSHGFMTSVAIRPLLPTADLRDLSEIVNLTSEWCYGYISGPLYLSDRLKTSKKWTRLNVVSTGTRAVDWMNHRQSFDYVLHGQLLSQVRDLVAAKGLTLFEDNLQLVSRCEAFCVSDVGRMKPVDLKGLSCSVASA